LFTVKKEQFYEKEAILAQENLMYIQTDLHSSSLAEEVKFESSDYIVSKNKRDEDQI
jgi:hypothetical protein